MWPIDGAHLDQQKNRSNRDSRGKTPSDRKDIPVDTKSFPNFRWNELIDVFYCNVRHGTLQNFLKISIKNSKCAVSNKHIQDGRPGRYENRRGSKKRQNDPTPTQERECPNFESDGTLPRSSN